MKLEICVDSIEDIKVCNKYSDVVSRIELTYAMQLGGLTPSLALVKKTREILDDKIDLVCMIRLRAGDFYYTDTEFEIMYNEAKSIVKYCDGLVFGALNKENDVDVDKTLKIIQLCKEHNKEMIFHKAIDVSNDYFKNLETLDNLGVTRVLTSGHDKNPVIGLENLNNINLNLEILVGGGVTLENIYLFKNFQVHGSFSENVETILGPLQKISEDKLKELRKSNLF